jgi:hypothetical protein
MKVKRLQEELEMERGNTLILKTQYENALKQLHEQDDLRAKDTIRENGLLHFR